MKINNSKIFWIIIIAIVLFAIFLTKSIIGEDAFNDSNSSLAGLVFLIIIALIIGLFWGIGRKKK